MTQTSRPRFFYGWLIVLIAFWSYFVVSGTGLTTFGQFMGPLSQAFGWSVGLIALANTVRLLASIVVAPLVGWLIDRAGPRLVMSAGALVTGAAYLTLFFLADPLVFYLVFTVGISLGFSLLGGTPAQAAVAHWFRRSRGMALAVTSIGASLGGVVMAPLVQYLMGEAGWRFALGAIGAGILLALLPLIALLMRNYPEQVGAQLDGDTDAAEGLEPRAAARGTPVLRADERNWTIREIWVSPDFLKLALGFMFASTLYTLIEVFQFPILTSRGLDGGSAALFVSIYSFCAAASKFGWGYLADRSDMRKVALATIWLNSLALAALAFAGSQPAFWLYAVVGGASGGGQSVLLFAMIARSFGRRSFGTVAGALTTLGYIAPAIAVPLAGFVFDSMHSYTLVFCTVAALAALTSLGLLALRRQESG